MRITVNLSHFFADHRSKAKIYIKENMKHIQDLQCRISKIFDIDNFYLNCENHYLPPSENVRLLKDDDIVWAIPISDKLIEQESSALTSVETQEIEPIKKKKKKKRNEHEVPTVEVELKKRKLNSKNESTSSEDKISNNEQTAEEISPITSKTEESVFNDSGRDSLDSSKSENKRNNEVTSVNVKSLVGTFENKIDFKKHSERLSKNLAVNDINKRVNIVKTIIVRNSLTDCNANLSVSTKNEVSPSSHIINRENGTENKPQNDDSGFETPKNQTNSLDSSCSTSRLDTTAENSCSSSFEGGSFKRKRIRVRKRKRGNKAPEPVKKLAKPTFDLIPRPLLTKAKNPHHVRFEDDSNEQENVTVIDIDDSAAKCENVQEKVQTSEKMSVEEQKQKKAIEKEELTEEFILKQPIMQSMQPRQGDIVAFKILRISESYTPEVSSRIVGKIISYNPPNAEVIFDIISGQDQCVQPQGKFALITEEETEAKNSNHYNCKWSDLLEPRLLYP